MLNIWLFISVGIYLDNLICSRKPYHLILIMTTPYWHLFATYWPILLPWYMCSRFSWKSSHFKISIAVTHFTHGVFTSLPGKESIMRILRKYALVIYIYTYMKYVYTYSIYVYTYNPLENVHKNPLLMINRLPPVTNKYCLNIF